MFLQYFKKETEVANELYQVIKVPIRALIRFHIENFCLGAMTKNSPSPSPYETRRRWRKGRGQREVGRATGGEGTGCVLRRYRQRSCLGSVLSPSPHLRSVLSGLEMNSGPGGTGQSGQWGRLCPSPQAHPSV